MKSINSVAGSLDTGLAILEAVANMPVCTSSTVAESLGICQRKAQRYLVQLEKHGYTRKLGDQEFRWYLTDKAKIFGA